MKRFASRFLLCMILLGAESFALYAQAPSTSQIRSDEEDFKKFLPPNEVVNWGVGVYGAVRGTLNTAFNPPIPTYLPSLTLTSNGIEVSITPTFDVGVMLYAPMLFAEKVGINLDLGLTSYSFGSQIVPRNILNVSKPYTDKIFSAANNDRITALREEQIKYETTYSYLTASPVLNLGGFLLGFNIGIPFGAGKTVLQKTLGSTELGIAPNSEIAIPASAPQLFIEPKIGLQVPLIQIKNVGTFFLNANLTYSLFGSPFVVNSFDTLSRHVDVALRKTGYIRNAADYRPERATPYDTINVRPISANIGLSFVLNFTNKTEQEEFLQEERKADSLRIVATKVRGTQEYLRNKSIMLADSAINTIILSSKISDRIAKAEQDVLEQQKKVLKTELTETKKKVFQAQIISVSGTREDGTEVENPTVRVEQFAATAQRSLLPVIFFDQGSAIPPTSRYRRIQGAERESYKFPSDPNASATSLYQHVLNIVGKRMASSSGKLTITGQQTRDEADAKLAEKRAEAIATYLMDVWKIPANRLQRATKPADASNQADKRSVGLSSDSPEVLAPLSIDYTTRLASPPVLNFGLEINTGAGLKQWELEFQQIVDNQPVTLKEVRGTDPYPQRYEWRLNDEPATMPQSSEPVTVRIGAYDVNNAAAPDAVLRSVKIEQVSLESKRKSGAADKKVLTFECLFGASLNDMDASSKAALEAAKRSITPQSRVSIIVSGGNTSVNARAVAQALSLDARSAVLRDAAISPTATAASTPEADAYKRIIKIRVESPVK